MSSGDVKPLMRTGDPWTIACAIILKISLLNAASRHSRREAVFLLGCVHGNTRNNWQQVPEKADSQDFWGVSAWDVSPGCPEAEEANSPHMESDASPSLPGGKHSAAFNRTSAILGDAGDTSSALPDRLT